MRKQAPCFYVGTRREERGQLEIEFAEEQADQGDEVTDVAIAAGAAVGGLNESTAGFQGAVADPGVKPVDTPSQYRRSARANSTLGLALGVVPLVSEPEAARTLKFRSPLLLFPARGIDRFAGEFGYMKRIECDQGLRQMLAHTLQEGGRHIRTDALNSVSVAPMPGEVLSKEAYRFGRALRAGKGLAPTARHPVHEQAEVGMPRARDVGTGTANTRRHPVPVPVCVHGACPRLRTAPAGAIATA